MYSQNGYPPQQCPPNFQTMGYAAPQPGYPNAQGFPPQPGTQVYPNQGFQPQTGYPPAQSGYPPVQAGYPPPQAGYPPPQAGYPPPQTGYLPAQAGQPPVQHGMPQRQAPFPQVQAGFPSNSPKFNPTLTPVSPFEPRKDAEKLRKAMKGLGTDEKSIIQVLARRTYEQRERIAHEYQTAFGKDMIDNLKRECSGRFRDLLMVMMTPKPQFYAKEIHDAVAGLGTDDEVLIEVMCTMTSHEIKAIKDAYTTKFKNTLESDLGGDTSGNFKKLLIELCECKRSQELYVNQESAREDAKSLYKAGEKRLGTDESTFVSIFCTRSYTQLEAIFKEYQVVSGHDIDKAIKSEFSGNIEKALRAIVRSVRNKPLFFADALHKSMKGLGTNDRQLIRIMVTRCEIDLGDIADVFKMNQGKPLKSWIEGDCSGHYKNCLIALLGSK